MATKKDKKAPGYEILFTNAIHESNNVSRLRPPKLYLCPNGIVLKIRTVSNLLLSELRKAIEQEFEDSGEAPQVPTEVINDGGPLSGTTIENYDHPDYLVALNKYRDRIDDLINERSPEFLIGRGVVDIGTVPVEMIDRWDDFPEAQRQEEFQPVDWWQEETELYRRENPGLDLPLSDVVTFVGYLCHSTAQQMGILYNEIMSVPSVGEMVDSFRDPTKRIGDVAKPNGVVEEKGQVAL